MIPLKLPFGRYSAWNLFQCSTHVLRQGTWVPRELVTDVLPRLIARVLTNETFRTPAGDLFDGAIGTMLYQRGVFLNRCFEAVNIERPEMVRRIHEEYLQAGAMVLTANTFGANRLKLDVHGQSEHFEAINRAGVRIAREVAGGRAYVAGSVGPTGLDLAALASTAGPKAEAAIREHVSLLVDAGVDVICLETFGVVSELEMAIRVAKEVCTLSVVLCMFTGADTAEKLTTRHGRSAFHAGADVIVNCGGGRTTSSTSPQRFASKTSHGYGQCREPKTVEDRTIYVANPEFFGVYARLFFKAGVNGIGGCCGTTPEHVRRMANSARMLPTSNGVLDADRRRVTPPDGICPLPEHRSDLGQNRPR